MFYIFLIAMDAGRAMLLFAIGQPLGDNGLKWLKLHLMNMYGLMKKQVILYFYVFFFRFADVSYLVPL